MDTAWTWELSDHCAKYSFLTESKGLTMREVERIFQLDPEPPVLENMSAGVSLMPSPTMQTVLPCARRRSMAAAFSSGRTSEST